MRQHLAFVPVPCCANSSGARTSKRASRSPQMMPDECVEMSRPLMPAYRQRTCLGVEGAQEQLGREERREDEDHACKGS